MSIRVLVVIVTYNSADDISKCLTSIRESCSERDEIVVFDNSSSDTTVEVAEKILSRSQVVRSPDGNVGFGRACNLAVRSRSSEWVLLLNPDTVSGPGLIDELLATAVRHPTASIYGGRSVFRDGSLDPRTCWAEPTVWSLICSLLGLSALAPWSRFVNPEMLPGWARDTERHVDIVTGCLMLVSRQMWDMLEGFDERFFMYGEDAQLCLRARALGADPIISPNAVIRHEVGKSSTRVEKLVMLTTGRMTYAREHPRHVFRLLGPALIYTNIATRALASRVLGKRTEWRMVWAKRRAWSTGYQQTSRDVSSRLHE